jgi:hypothetical protein
MSTTRQLTSPIHGWAAPVIGRVTPVIGRVTPASTKAASTGGYGY